MTYRNIRDIWHKSNAQERRQKYGSEKNTTKKPAHRTSIKAKAKP